MTEPLYLGVYWKNRRLTMREYIVATKRFLARLQEVHPVFKNLVSWGNTEDSGVVLLPDLSNLDELVLRRGYSKDYVYPKPRPDGGPSLESDCTRGFVTSYSNDKPGAEGKVGVMITAGVYSPALSNAVVIDFPSARYPEFLEYDFVKRLLTVSVECWQPQRAVVTSRAFFDKVGGESGRRTIGWMTWFSEPAVCEALPKGVECEPLGGGGLVTTTRELLSADSPAHVETASRIRSALQASGLLK